MALRAGEMLVSVKIININLVSFNEIGDETEFIDELFRQRILDIIDQRGKLHNPITGTGGMLFGHVEKMDAQYLNKQKLKIGDEIISMTSLTVTPIKIERIISIDYESAQLSVEGHAILFSDSPVVKVPSDLPLKTVISAMDEAGAPMRTDEIVSEGDRVLIMGGSGKVGLLCAFAATRKLRGKGKLVGLVANQMDREKLESIHLFDDIITMDATDITNTGYTDTMTDFDDSFDVVINCINKPDTEIISLIASRPRGTLFFATLSSNERLAALTAESMGKEVRIVTYTGFMEGHAEFTMNLMREYPQLQTLLTTRALFVSPRDSVRNYNVSTVKKCAEVESDGYIFSSPQSQATLRQALKVARYNSTVLIYGESGVGKEIIANIIHRNSDRRSFPMVKINCAAIPENLLESELFGYEKGSFTGASAKGKKGLWEAAQNGTLFLDEVGELPLSFQAKLLRVIQEKEITRVGGISPIKVNVRIIAATNRNLADMVKQRAFRDDLYYRLNAFPLYVAPLRDRREDIVPLARHFVEKYNKEFNIEKSISDSALNLLSVQTLRGNIRELQNIIQQSMINVSCDLIESSDILHTLANMSRNTQEESGRAPEQAGVSREYSGTLSDMLDGYERDILTVYRKKYRTTQQLADALGTSQPTIVRKLKKYGIGQIKE
jgi:TyrR family helix-turn-helix protein